MNKMKREFKADSLVLHDGLLRQDSNNEHSRNLIALIESALERQSTFPKMHRGDIVQALLAAAYVIENVSLKYRAADIKP